jgi:NnrS protein
MAWPGGVIGRVSAILSGGWTLGSDCPSAVSSWFQCLGVVVAGDCGAARTHGRRDRHDDPGGDDPCTLGHSGTTLAAGPGTTLIYALVTVGAPYRVLAPLTGAHYTAAVWLSAVCWSMAFGLFVRLYLEPL